MKEIREIFETVRTYCGMMFLDAKMHRCKDAKPFTENTESILAPMAGEDAIVHERLVSVTSAGAGENQNEIIQSNPSPEFLNSLPFIKKFYPLPFGAREKFTKITNETDAISRHSERIAKESSLLQYKAAAKNENNSIETDHASMPLGIFASKSVSLSDWQIRPTALKHAAFTLAEGATHVAHCDKLRRAAFTLAEVLITLGIIGVVAALTLPTLIQNHQKQVYVTQLKKAYSTLNNAINKMAVDEGVVDWAQTQCGYQAYSSEESTEDNSTPYINPACTNNLAKQMNVLKVEADYFADCSEWCTGLGVGPAIMTADGITYQFDCSGFGYAYVDVNGIKKGPNKEGRDVFLFGIDAIDNKIIPDGNYNDSWKNCSATNLSTSCTAKVLIEGKMNY